MATKEIEVKRYRDALTTIFAREVTNANGEVTGGVYVKAIRVQMADGTEEVRLHVEDGGELKPPVQFKMDELRAKILKIKNYSASFNGLDIQEIINGLRDKKDGMNIIGEQKKLGWQRDREGHVTGWLCSSALDMEGNEIAKDIFGNSPYGSGDVTENISFVKGYLNMGVARQAVFLYGLAAVVAGYMGKTLLINLCGKSSFGKTTVSKLVISLFAEPNNDRLCKTFNMTVNKLAENLDGLFGVAVLVDDLSLLPPSVKRNQDNMVYVLESGKEKERMKVKQFDREPAAWNTTIVMSSEESILMDCDPEKEGAIGRLMELDIFEKDLFNNADEADKVKKQYGETYGLFADYFVKKLITSGKLNVLPSLYEKEAKRVREGKSDVMARVAENIAYITLTASLLKETMGIDIAPAPVKDYLLKTAEDKLESIRVMQKDEKIMRVIYPRIIDVGRQAINFNREDSHELFIPSEVMKGLYQLFQSEYGYKPIEIKRGLKAAEVLKANDGPYGYTTTVNGKSKRGVCLLIKKEHLADSTEGETETDGTT